MSVFKVKLNNMKQGLLDINASTHPADGAYGQMGAQMDPSIQRQIFVAGPNGTYRLLVDGETFTDCNYWKQFAYPQVAAEAAFIEVTTDDGSVWSPIPEENTYAVGATMSSLDTTYDTTNSVDFATTYGGAAQFLQVQNLDSTAVVTGELNGDTNVTFTLAGGETQVFNQGDLAITMLKLKSDTADSDASWLGSIRSTCNS